MARPKILTDEQIKAKRKILQNKLVQIRPPEELTDKLDAFINDKKTNSIKDKNTNRNEVIIKMINAYPPFKEFVLTRYQKQA